MFRFIRPSLPSPSEWLPYLELAYQAHTFSNFGPVSTQLERSLSEKYGQGRRIAILVANATSGISAALMALSVQGCVVIPDFTFPATAMAVLMAGCQPLLCEVDPHSWELSPQALEEILRRQHVSAVIPVRSYGFCRDLKAIMTLCRSYGALVIIDSASAFGGRLDQGDWVGQQGEMEIFSLHATKVFGIGEGGVVLTPPEHVPKLRQAISYGLKNEDILIRGLNGKLSEFHAAVGMAMLNHIDRFIQHRQEISHRYRDVLSTVPVTHPQQPGGMPWQTYPILLPTYVDQEQLLLESLRNGLELRRYYKPALHKTPLFSNFMATDCTISSDLSTRMVCLPIYSDMTDIELEQILNIFHKCFDKLAAR